VHNLWVIPMKDFKKLPKMKTGGSVKKYAEGGSTKDCIGEVCIKPQKVSLADAAKVAMSKDDDGRPTYGAKSKIGTRAAQAVYDKNWMNSKMSVDDMYDKTIKARDEADNEVQRETTRGIRPEKRNYKTGGPVGLYANIHAKRERIKAGSGEKMRKPGAEGAPTKQAFIESAKTAKKK